MTASTETPTHLCDNKWQARCIKHGIAKVTELHLYLPSPLCDDEEQDAVTEEMRYDLFECECLGRAGCCES